MTCTKKMINIYPKQYVMLNVKCRYTLTERSISRTTINKRMLLYPIDFAIKVVGYIIGGVDIIHPKKEKKA